eukprot:TRINITY_DN92967_c0_g1_i1.p1 TRINITY_DN92967_c0_g1~~TRINITY_DN92967_c0_g1_i1.p1  ORF type:complete len:743 (-),score=112.60 TRINITY_DN92967_c0_g1_i1:218-2446(-)
MSRRLSGGEHGSMLLRDSHSLSLDRSGSLSDLHLRRSSSLADSGGIADREHHHHIVDSHGGGGDMPEAAVRDSSVQRSMRIQDIASEVLRLRLVQSQHRQLEAQLRAAHEQLEQMPLERMGALRNHLEMAFRPGGAPGTLGSVNGGVPPTSLLGFMECLCVVCDVQIATRKQDDLVIATKWLLHEPKLLIDRIIHMPPAKPAQSRRLAPFLLSRDSSWRGHLGEAGQCYENLRSWLSCYYQVSLVSSQMEETSKQLEENERLLEEQHLMETEGSTGGVDGSLNAPRAWRTLRTSSSGVRRSSSVQSNSSTGSWRGERSQSPAANERVAVVGGLRPSPRQGTPGTASPGTRGPAPRLSFRGMPNTGSLANLHSGNSAAPSSARGPHSHSSGALGSARATTTRQGAPPPNPSPRQYEPPRMLMSGRRHNAPSVKERRSPSNGPREPALAVGGGSPRRIEAVASGLPPQSNYHGLETPPIDELSEPGLGRSKSLQSIREPPLEPAATTAPAPAPAPTPSHYTPGITPPLSNRGGIREALHSGRLEPHSVRVRNAQAETLHVQRVGSSAASPRYEPHSARHSPRPATTARTGRVGGVSGASPPAAGSGGTPSTNKPGGAIRFSSGRRLRPSESASTLQSPPSHATTDAGSGGTVGDTGGPGAGPGASTGIGGSGVAGPPLPPTGYSGWQAQQQERQRTVTPRSLAASRSTPALEMRRVTGRLSSGATVSRSTPDQTPRPMQSARIR